ncbi:MAG TPA: hypothetical protein PLK12_05580 [Prolixibacteraceae bacterium]|nr:hypothetical protein [Prolixibacteraceae bacterium]
MNYSFFIVNYNADEHVMNLVKSIQTARDKCTKSNVALHIIDHSGKNAAELDRFRQNMLSLSLPVTIHSDGSNNGYFGGLQPAQKQVRATDDFVIYCNPDVQVDPDFFTELEKTRIHDSALIAPSIRCKDEGFDQNPMYRKRLKKSKLMALLLLYRSNVVFYLYDKLYNYRKSRRSRVKSRSNRETKEAWIYAAHGSFLIFSHVPFFTGLPPFPCFLFGEELFLAEEARKSGLKIGYNPAIKVTDIRHASVNKLKIKELRTLTLKSIRFILHHYYR